MPPNGHKKDIKNKEVYNQHKAMEENLVIWKSPFQTLYYALSECFFRFAQLCCTIVRHKTTCILILCLISVAFILNSVDGAHSEIFNYMKGTTMWWGWWIWLGFLSTCGFGTGLHTFVLYLGPFIAEVTMSAYECGTLKFPRPPYPERIICPDGTHDEPITFWKIMRKVQMESIMWGIGTALGELPPYFMAQGARLTGKYDDDLTDFEEIIKSDGSADRSITNSMSLQRKMEIFLHRLIVRAGFVGILLCASIPNPLFDLAGMTCGHFLVPFWSFFGATLIGKAIVKVHLQQFTVIALSSEHHIDTMVELLGRVPYYGKQLQVPFLEYLRQQKENLYNKVPGGQQSWLQSILFCIVTTLIVSFMVSILHALARNYHRRLLEWKLQMEGEIDCKVD